jgi:hypothetical protein
VPTSRCAATLANAKMTQQCCSCSDEDGGSDVSDAMFLTHSGHAAVVVKHCEHIQQADGVYWIATVTQVPTATKLLVEGMETKSDTTISTILSMPLPMNWALWLSSQDRSSGKAVLAKCHIQ